MAKHMEIWGGWKPNQCMSVLDGAAAFGKRSGCGTDAPRRRVQATRANHQGWICG